MNAPATFQRSMDRVLNVLEQVSSCYIDDIVVHSKVWSDHIRQVRNVMSRLRQFGLTVNAKKCVWGVAETEYLGYKVGRGKVQIPELRVRVRVSIQHKTI